MRRVGPAAATALLLIGCASASAAGPTRAVRLPQIPNAVATGAGSVWVASAGTLLRVDPRTHAIVSRTRIGRAPVALAVAGRRVWIANGSGTTVDPNAPGGNSVISVDTRTGRVDATIAVRDPDSIAAGAGAVWVATPGSGRGRIVQIDPATSRLRRTIDVAADGPVEVAAGLGFAWALAPSIRAGRPSRSTLFRIDPRSGRIEARIAVAGSSDRLAVGAGGVWIATDRAVVEIDPRSGRRVGRAVAVRAGALCVGAGAVWLAGAGGSVWRVEPVRHALERAAASVGSSADELAAGFGAVWVADASDRTLVELPA